ncbi:hypothetical protein NE237_030113 [Protea cynaroides]|uniref:Uncharacterized protein n=1 Tax=Protea cynaroides TaxID=273540 RepID=A0A9Q0JVG2_9MAGN|nr:hypothetical protein NE237_030113 [Protea cynaroides]
MPRANVRVPDPTKAIRGFGLLLLGLTPALKPEVNSARGSQISMLQPMLDKTDPFFHLWDHSTLSGGLPRDVTYNRPALAKEASVLALRAKNFKSDSEQKRK